MKLITALPAASLALVAALMPAPMKYALPAEGTITAMCVPPAFSSPAEAYEKWWLVFGVNPAQHWLAGDGGWTIRHPGTCNILHVFGDTAVYDSLGRRKMPHGTAVVQKFGNTLRWIGGDGSIVPDSADGTVDWPGPLAWDNGKLYSFTSHIKPIPGGWEDRGKDLAEFTWDGEDALAYRGKWVTPSTGRPGRVGTVSNIMWGAATVRIGNWHYVYGTYSEPGWFGNRVYLASAPTGSLANSSRWTYWNGTGWSHKESAAKPVISEFGGPESAFSANFDNGLVKLVSKKNGTFGSDVQRWSFSGVAGPWTLTRVASSPWVANVDQTYLPIAHYDIPRFADGKVALTISHGRGSSGSLDDMYQQPERYRNSWQGIAP